MERYMPRTVSVGCQTASDVVKYSIPQNSEATAQQALDSVVRGLKDGKKLQRIELMLPLIGATDLDDWPGGIRQQFKAARPMVEQILLGLRRELQTSQMLEGSILDQGDATASWENDKITAVLFPTAETVSYIDQAVKKGADRLVLLINPQWNKGGSNFVSDFGWGKKKADAEGLINSFEFSYSFEQRKQGGANIKILRQYPDDWQAMVTEDDRHFDLIGTTENRPSYQTVEGMLKKAYPDEDIFSRFVKELKEKNDMN
ncbi:hypothetical protein AAMO2058_000365200 [Amorphochlora amoebiformis]